MGLLFTIPCNAPENIMKASHSFSQPETYPGLPQTTKMESFETTVNGFQLLFIVAKLSILEVCRRPGSASGNIGHIQRFCRFSDILNNGFISICRRKCNIQKYTR